MALAQGTNYSFVTNLLRYDANTFEVLEARQITAVLTLAEGSTSFSYIPLFTPPNGLPIVQTTLQILALNDGTTQITTAPDVQVFGEITNADTTRTVVLGLSWEDETAEEVVEYTFCIAGAPLPPIDMSVDLSQNGIGGAAPKPFSSEDVIDLTALSKGGASVPNLITGTAAAEELIGTDGDDSIEGLGGNDSLRGELGNDLLSGGEGDDWIYAEPGDDTYRAGDGFDRADYRDAPGPVNLNLMTGIGTDGHGGTDRFFDVERITGSAFDDTLTGNDAELNSFSGEGGNDLIAGNGGFDFIWYGRAPGAVQVNLATGVVTGAEGNDTISSIEGIGGSNYADSITGNDDDNYFVLDQEGDEFTPNFLVGGDDTVDGAGGWDIVSYGDAVGAVSVNLASGTATDGQGNTDTLRNIEEIRGSNYADSLTGDGGDNSLRGGEGDDTLGAGGGNDTVDAGAGNDLGFAGAGNDSLSGGDGDDSLYGAADDDTLDGGAGADLLGGGPGNDSALGGAGNDGLWGSLGNDTLRGEAGADTLGGAAGDDSLDGGEGDDEIWTAAGNDKAEGGAGADTLGGAAGNDTLSGGAGRDELWGAADNDLLDGGDDADQVGGGSGNDTVQGGNGDDAVYGGLGNDVVSGGSGNDALFGAAGDDTLTGGAGDDTIYGGPGADVFVFGRGDGADEIGFFSATDDRLQLDGALFTGTLTTAQIVTQFGSVQGNDYVLDFGGGDRIILLDRAAITGLDGLIDIA